MVLHNGTKVEHQLILLESFCPYCALAIKTGELYCSRHGDNMASLQSGVFYIKGKKFEECEPHVTRLSLNFNLDSTQSYFIGKREFKVSPSRFLLINEGRSFTTFSDCETESRMITIAFKVGLAEQMLHTFSNTHEALLSNPVPAVSSTEFFEQTYLADHTIRSYVESVTTQTTLDELELQEHLNNILVYVLQQQTDVWRQIESIDKTKASTRQEIYRRLQTAFEYLHNNFQHPITVDDLAREACLSTFHFKRLFKELYHQAPYQCIKALRLEKAKELLKKGLPVHEVCKMSGWNDRSSFIRLFRKEFGTTPARHRT